MSLAAVIVASLPLWSFPQAAAQAPSLTKVTPSGRTDLTSNSVLVTLTGAGFTDDATIAFDPAGVMTASGWNQTGGVSATVTFTLANPKTSVPTVDVWVQTANGPSAKVPFSTGVLTNICLESLQTGGCQLRWEIEATGVTGNSNQSNNSTASNILVTLDYQWHSPKNRIQKELLRNAGASSPTDSWTDHLSVHANVKSGYTQVVAANNVQVAPNTSGGTSGCSTTCTIAVPQQAFVAEVGGRLGWTTGVNGQGTFGEFGLGAHGSFEYLIPKNQIVQSGGLTYIDLSSANSNNAVGFYEATGHFRLAQLGHDKTLPNAATVNSSSLLIFEGGYQNNRGLQGLVASSPQTSTRGRYVGRFYLNPEISSTNHTKITVGMEYSGGINGGPHVVQMFFGTNLNPAKLFGKGGG
ncbi:MAG TPA: hypothetical protein VJP02_05650 [Candidatus Sulfotelmatobacter sp.]|nr:hypothetical protein [Candidatus Sulfotelmatobacter sp.]